MTTKSRVESTAKRRKNTSKKRSPAGLLLNEKNAQYGARHGGLFVSRHIDVIQVGNDIGFGLEGLRPDGNVVPVEHQRNRVPRGPDVKFISLGGLWYGSGVFDLGQTDAL